MDIPKTAPHSRLAAVLTETFGFGPALASIAALFIIAVFFLAVVWFIRSAPPRTITLSSGPPGSTLQRYAESYQKILAAYGVTLQILPSAGSQANLQQLESAESHVDIGFVQSGLAQNGNVSGLVSLGSIAYQPLWVFYRSPARIIRLSELGGKKIAVGPPGSGTRVLALALLQANGITDTSATLQNQDAEAAAADLLAGKLDAVFLMGDSASIQTLRTLIRSPEIQLYNFVQADAYVRRFSYLNKMTLPEGSIDLGKNLPAENMALVGPTVELVARKGLNPALSDLLLEAAQEVHGKPSLLQKQGEFPAPLEHEFKISEDARRYYKSGKNITHRIIGSFWLASFVNRTLVAFLPVLIVLIPALRFFPNAYRWRIRMKLYHHYRRLLRLEREAAGGVTHEREEDLLRRLNEIEDGVSRLKVPASFADQYYALRGYIMFVRARLKSPART
ncbi:MAG TPA: TAXI family TRAP transporter solute-binding subunit [Opitutaceae bacterium]|nr:TAXI family TRAP transporter solute-binding subunit [Opitutaceae bacterium]